MNAAEFLGVISSFLASHALGQDPGIIVAYSGGADSGALLTALSELGLKKLRAVHVTHSIRPEPEGEAESSLVKTICRSLNIPLTVARIKRGAIEKLAKKEKIGIEAAARAFRYHILEKCALRFGYPTIATAHTLDDQLETILARLFNSSGPEGLSGIPVFRALGSGITLVRPLLFASRNDIERYAREKSLTWVNDSSNSDNVFLRNRLRNLLIPRLDADFSGWRSGLMGTSLKIAHDARALAAILERVLGLCGFDSKTMTFTIPTKEFIRCVIPIQERLLRHAIGTVTSGTRLSSRALHDSVLSIAGGASRLEVLDARIIVAQEVISISPLLDFRVERGYFFMIASEGAQKAGRMEISANWEAPGGNRMNYLLEGAFTFPLIVRSRRPGDSIVISGKSVRIDDLIKSWRLDERTRGILPILEDTGGIVAVMPGAILGGNFPDRVRFRDYKGRKDGRILRINMKGA